MKCTADKKDGNRCTNENEYGTLCKVHARQLACTPSGFQRRRVLRLHHRSDPEELYSVAIDAYLSLNDATAIRTASAMSYRYKVIELLFGGEEFTAEQIVTEINEVCPYELNHWKIGSLLRAMLTEGTIVRMRTTRNGKSTSVYLIRSQEHETGATAQGN